MGFSFKVAPGVRVRASSRGIRTSIGPRAARIHVGGGRAGVSTGFGPVTLYHSVGGSSRRRTQGGQTKTSIAARERQLRQAAKLQQAADLVAAFDAIMNVHREHFAAVSAPIAPQPPPVDEAPIRHRHEQEALRGIGVLHRAERSAARQQAAASAAAEIAAVSGALQQQRADWQAQLDAQWSRLLANAPDAVIATLTEAFEDNEAPAAIAGVTGDEASIVVLVPDPDVIPERMPERTAAGNLSLKKLAKGVQHSYYAELVFGHVLATVREALAVAPGLGSARVAAVRWSALDAYGKRRLECLMAAQFTRQALTGIQWNTAAASQVVRDAAGETHLRQMASGELRPLDLAHEPELADLMRSIGYDDGSGNPGP